MSSYDANFILFSYPLEYIIVILIASYKNDTNVIIIFKYFLIFI
jgi:hypothetical protein